MDDNAIGRREFLDGSTRPVYRDAEGPYMLGRYGEHVYGVWLYDPDDLGDDPELPAADPCLTLPAPPDFGP